jgi:putative ABC transport system permease protein
MKNLAYALRILVRQPRYTVLAILTVAVGIGVNAAMFGLLDAVYFRPLPIADPDRLVDVRLESPGSRFSVLSYQEFLDLERSVPAFQDVMAIGQRGVTLNHNGDAQLQIIHYVSGRYFPSLGIPMHLGRGFTDADDRSDATTPQVVINHEVWQRLGSPSDIIGRTVQLNSTMFTVIGVTAPGFVGLDRTVRTHFWVTTAQAPFVVAGLRAELDDRNHRWFEIVARLSDTADVAQAAAGLDVVLSRWRARDARAYQDARLVVQSQRDATRRETRQGTVFLALVGLVLLIACANVANLTLARGEGRRREMALRAALGATRLNLLRQMLLESALVSLAAAAAGVLLASWLISLFPALLPPAARFAMALDVRVDTRLLAFAALLAALATALVGIVPAWRSSRTDITSGLKSQAPTVAGSGRGVQLRDVLVVSEIAMSGVVIIAAGLLVRSFAYSLAVEPGFDTRRNVATFYVVPGLKGYDHDATYRYLESARRSAATAPGVQRVSYGIRLPGQGNEAGWSASFVIPGKEAPPGKDAFDIRYTMVGPDYFEVMGTSILSGRGIGDVDRPGSAAVAVISDAMARRLWPGESPLGKRIRMGRARPIDREIVGVAEDIRIGGLFEAPEMYVYVPYAQDQQAFGLLLVEAQGDTAAVVGSVKQRLAEIDPAIPVLAVSSFAEHMNLLLYEDRRNAWIGFAIALLALALGAVGVHGVVSLVTARRTREIGLRVVLGADRRQVLWLLLGKGVRLALVGAILGIAGGLAAGRLLQNQLHGIEATDPWSIVVGTTVLITVALAASFAPAWRATRLDPAVALRDE